MENNSRAKKKVLIFVPRFPVLSETFIQREIVKLVQKDNLDINVVAIDKGTAELSKEITDRVHFRKLTWPDSFVAAFYFFSKFSNDFFSFSLFSFCCFLVDSN